MALLEFRQSWITPGTGEPEVSKTMSLLELHVGDTNLTKNENIWSQSVQENIVVSTYPLAIWCLQSWWRLIFEPLPPHGRTPTIDWRMAHEMAASSHGFIWPSVVFASDGEEIQIWSSPSDSKCQQSARYLNGLSAPASIAIKDFQNSITDFISKVVSRLEATGLPHSELSELWKIVLDEQQDSESFTYRKLEAQMGFDPDECPQDIMDYAIELRRRYGDATLSELAPVYGKPTHVESLGAIENLTKAPGVIGRPSLPLPSTSTQNRRLAPWQKAVKDAQQVRKAIGNERGPIDTRTLCDLLGIASVDVDKWVPAGRSSVSVGIPNPDNSIKFVPRKMHPISKRSELARFIGDYLNGRQSRWLTNTDLGTARQKYQRAFSAAFLCPLNGLLEFVQNDFSEEAIEDAAANFNVIYQTVTSLLANNDLIDRTYHEGFPYRTNIAELHHLGEQAA